MSSCITRVVGVVVRTNAFEFFCAFTSASSFFFSVAFASVCCFAPFLTVSQGFSYKNKKIVVCAFDTPPPCTEKISYECLQSQ